MVSFYDRNTETFIPWTEFKDITELYYFDGDLKLLLMEALELIEVDFKTKLINNLSLRYNTPHRFMEKQLFITDGAFHNASRIISEGITKNKDNVFIKHYENKYNEPPLPPCRMVFQVLSFGEATIIYQSLNIKDRKLIANEYKLRFPQFESWIVCLSYLRNLCAHSDRVWSRKMTRKVKIRWAEQYFNENIDTLFAYLVVICYLLRIIAPWSVRFTKIEKLIDGRKSINLTKMWFPDNWREIIREKNMVIEDE